MKKRWDAAILLLVCALFVSVLMREFDTISDANQWDFRAAYFSAKAYEKGLNPYRNEEVNGLNDTPIPVHPYLTYTYHPYTLYYFRLFTWLPYPTAVAAYMAFNLALLLIVVGLWRRYFLERVNPLLFGVILVCSFNSALFMMLNSANTAVLEALLIWLALLAFSRDRPWPFLVLIAVISFVKGTPIVLSLMVFLLPGRRKNALPFLSVLLASALVWLSPLLFSPAIFRDWWSWASGIREVGRVNPSSWAFILDCVQGAGRERWFAHLGYLAWLAFVGATYIWLVRGRAPSAGRTELAFFTLLTYAVVVPRFKDYAFIQLIPVAYLLISKNPGLLLFHLFDYFTPGIDLPYFLKEYHPLMAAVIDWGYLGWLLSPARQRITLEEPVRDNPGALSTKCGVKP